MDIDTDAHQAAGHGAFEVIAASQVGCVRTAGAHGHAKALGGTYHNVGPQFTGRCEQGEGQ